MVDDRLRRRVLWKMPTGLYLLGSRSVEERNLMTLSWATQVCSEPKLLAVGVESGALTTRLVREGGGFTLNLLAREDRSVIRRFVKPAAWDPGAQTLAGQAVFEAPSGAPVLEGALAWLDCRLIQELALGKHTLFIGEIQEAGFGPGYQDAEDADVLRMEDTRMSYGG
jgi:flavin reductase (DIM6/NTAB) family NADH-FMN oxidoreductase RutF